ncbi:hypothetical protein PR202_ga26914 [Eleusine coracana subsp. coracana]|uniref:Uncharacterized protein n=1 Tax=Eleusine coracana subsp. coracana TaxID=191504 RepID=A0AAV5DFT7_ELECO|nr:hypothetical protein PR202_ga26914 [Eleusine coracana subsp. coracana]
MLGPPLTEKVDDHVKDKLEAPLLQPVKQTECVERIYVPKILLSLYLLDDASSLVRPVLTRNNEVQGQPRRITFDEKDGNTGNKIEQMAATQKEDGGLKELAGDKMVKAREETNNNSVNVPNTNMQAVAEHTNGENGIEVDGAKGQGLIQNTSHIETQETDQFEAVLPVQNP